jgi:hypothetical protein
MYGSGEQVKRCVMWASIDVEKLSFGNAHVHFPL